MIAIGHACSVRGQRVPRRKVDGPEGQKVLKILRFDSSLWPLRVEDCCFAAMIIKSALRTLLPDGLVILSEARRILGTRQQ
mgnify:CR=1 FL=1